MMAGLDTDTAASNRRDAPSLPPEPVRPDITAAKVRSEDAIPPPPLLGESDLRLGTGPIPASRY